MNTGQNYVKVHWLHIDDEIFEFDYFIQQYIFLLGW